MPTTAYISSDPQLQAALDAQRADLETRVADLTKKIERTSDKSAAKTLKALRRQTYELLAELQGQHPPRLFDERAALNDLEAEVRLIHEACAEIRAEWADHARRDPISAIEYANRVIAEQTRDEQALLLEERWQELAAREGRTLATFRKAYDHVARIRRRDLFGKLHGRSTSYLYNAIAHEQCRALAALEAGGDRILDRLNSYEEAAAAMPHVA